MEASRPVVTGHDTNSIVKHTWRDKHCTVTCKLGHGRWRREQARRDREALLLQGTMAFIVKLVHKPPS